ncbi:hypothetical protein SHJG_0208 [Streptomyces hygroscopicus subsp. jinggangensis 5008]|nr:hypothetical protein SHJG_0208 [Streptomyces hygroscopicus subsp. jinggangensis 5008]
MKARLDALAGSGNVTESDAFGLALTHAVAELAGFGGAIHLSAPPARLRLVASVGLQPALRQAWEVIEQEGDTVPARAVKQGGAVWLPLDAHGDADDPSGRSAAVHLGGGAAAVPLRGSGQVTGALTVLTGAHGKPSMEQWGFLHAVAVWVEQRLGQGPSPAPRRHEDPRASDLRQVLKAVEIGSWNADLRTGEILWDEACMLLHGVTPGSFVPGVETWLGVIHPDDLPRTLAAVEAAIAKRGLYEAEYRTRRPDGVYGWVRVRGSVMLDDQGHVSRLVGTVWDSSEARSALDALGRAVRHMHDGFLTMDGDWRVTFGNAEAEHILGLAGDELLGRLVWELPPIQHMPALEAVFRESAVKDAPVDLDVRMPDTERDYRLRLVPGRGVRGVYFTDVTEAVRYEAERSAAAQIAAERSSWISELTAALAKATTALDVLDAVARQVMPHGVTGLKMQVIEDDQLHDIGEAGRRPAVSDQRADYASAPCQPVWEAVLTGQPLLISSLSEFRARFPEAAEHLPTTDDQAWAFVPLAASGHTFGVCVLALDQPRVLNEEECALLTAVTALVAHALERARLYDAEHTRSRRLQRSLLPQTLPVLSACTLAARYLPAEQGLDVGGDWYDAIPLPSARVALVIGDVMGHGLSEAATMGRLRTAVHTLAALELPPEEIMGHLNDIVSGLGDDAYATCLYALYDSTDSTCTIVSAGHPPLAVASPDGSVRIPDIPQNPPLGAAEPPFESVELVVPAEHLLVLFTDGLVESNDRDIDQGTARLEEVLRDAGRGDLTDLCHTLTGELLPAGRPASDDAALLIARVHALPAYHMASWLLPEDPRAAGRARELVREQLSAWGLDDLTMTTELLVSELVGNVIRHARGPLKVRLLRDAELLCEVFDGSLTMPRIRRALETDEGGRGLQLVAALSQQWGVRYTSTGKWIWAVQPLPSE